ncbi:PAS domain S-box protein [Arcobacteraceae bacterium]|nr:PAS domain S-box protein [Arcobacteraceae bacterium]
MIQKLYTFEENKELLEDFKKSDKFMLNLVFIHWILVSTLSAYSYNTYLLGLVGGGLLYFITLVAYKLYSGTPAFRIMVGIVLMTFTIISIQQNLGRIEMHFHVFIALAFLTVYKDLRPATIASVYIIVHHLLFTYYQMNNVSFFDTQIMVFNYSCGYDIAFLHAFYVIFEWIILYIVINSNVESFEKIHKYRYQLLHSNDNLQESVNNFQELFNMAREGIIILDENKNIVEFNKAARNIFGYKKKEFLGINVFKLIPPEEVEKVQTAIKKNIAEPYELNLLRKNGTIFPTLTSGANIVRNKKLWRISTILDLTEIKNKEQALIKSEKLAAMGDMIGNIAHQWRQPLSVISTSATGMQVQIKFSALSDEEIDKNCDLINTNAQYLSKTIDDFRDFIKGDREQVVFNLKHTVSSFIQLIEGSVKSNNIELISKIQDDIEIYGYPNELIQCFMNIYNNSKDVLVKLDEDDRFIFIDSFSQDDTIFIQFTDSGGGIPQKVLPKIFEPYFTTKHKTQGTGLGLHMTYNLIVDGMNGTIDAQNTTFTHNDKKYKGAVLTIKIEKSLDSKNGK